MAEATVQLERGASTGDPSALMDTTELRWFAEGSLPSEVASWFTSGGSDGAVEVRTDDYRVDGRCDIGVKRRSGTTLELKVRQRVDDPLTLAAGLVGRTETWRKWSPAAVSPGNGDDVTWIAVHKRIVKRLFSPHGDERTFSYEARTAMEAGCDVELAEITVGHLHAWTFAFAAFGPAQMHREEVVACWQALNRRGPAPDQLAASYTTPSNYPLWLNLFRTLR